MGAQQRTPGRCDNDSAWGQRSRAIFFQEEVGGEQSIGSKSLCLESGARQPRGISVALIVTLPFLASAPNSMSS
jgi:hypothetical protein